MFVDHRLTHSFEPGIDLDGVEPEKMPPLHEGDAPLVDEPTNVSHLDSEADGHGVDVDERLPIDTGLLRVLGHVALLPVRRFPSVANGTQTHPIGPLMGGISRELVSRDLRSGRSDTRRHTVEQVLLEHPLHTSPPF